jgi:lmo0472 protein
MSPSEDTETKQASTNTDVKSSWHQLLIIGNGFDLECGLRSRFIDFFSSRIKTPQRNFTEDDNDATHAPEELVSAFPTIWDLILRNKQDTNWFDIEKTIEMWVSGFTPEVTKVSGWCNSLRYTDYPPESDDEIIASYCKVRLSKIDEWISEDNVLTLFTDDLHLLEKQFARYLREQTYSSKPLGEQNANYHQTACGNLQTLLSESLPSNPEQLLSYSVLSFNYTGPFDLPTRESGQCVAYTNIHGLCREGEEIIFGIDGKEKLTDTIAGPFTKTYRLLGLGGPKAQDVVRSDTQCIKFYGHSLSDADYSYFQAIFDAVHLYSSDVSLVFFYRCFDEKDPLIHRSEMMNKVINLLTAYGATLENKDHGKNLIHKLLLEGRLSVQEIRFDSQSDN